MKARSKNLKKPGYGADEIGFDPAWEHYANFLADMGERPAGTSLDRLDAFKGYHKENCQ